MLVNAGGRRREDGFFVLSDGDCVKTVTHGQFLREVWALGTGMYMEKIRNQRVMIVGKNSYEWVLAAFSVMCGENTAVLADPGLNVEGLMKRAAEAGATVVIGDNGILSGLHGSFVKIPFSELRDKVREGESLLRQGNTDFEESAPDTEREAAVLFTTGTTGGVKAVALSHRNLCSSADSVYGYIEDHKRALIVLPLHHIAAFSTSLITSIRHGWEVAVVGDYRELIPMILKVRPGFMNLVPRLADVLLMWLSDEKNAEKSELSLREIGMGGTDISENYREEFRKYGIGLKAAYGLTETSGAVMIDGVPIGGIEVKLAGGEQGELLFRGPEIFAGYLNDGKATSQVFEGGWFHTGDIGRREPDGTYAIVGRLKNLIILPNGENVSPEELENRLEESPLIRESMVYGDGEELAAVVVMASGADDAVEAAALVRKEVDRICRVLPAYMRISKVSTQKEPLLRNGLGKLIRAAKP